MIGSRQLSLKETADLCHSLASSLHAGLSIPKALSMAGGGPGSRARAFCAAVKNELDQGEDFAGALKKQSQFLPPLVVAMLQIAVRTGNVPEVLRELERYYRFQLKLRRQFLSQIAWPIIQLVAAIFIIAFVIYIIGVIAPRGGNSDVLGIGLSGASGAAIWICGWFGTLAAIAAAIYYVRVVLRHSDRVDAILMRIPVLGRCLRTLALARLSFAMHLTLDSGLSVYKAVGLFLQASENGAFAATGPAIVADLKNGRSMDEAFARHVVYPQDFLEVVHAGVESGSLPEAMRRQSEQYREKSEIELQMLNQAAGWLVWFLVAGIIVFFIFRIAMTAYIGPMKDALKGAM